VQTPVSLLSLQPETDKKQPVKAVAGMPATQPVSEAVQPVSTQETDAPVVFKTLAELEVSASKCRLCNLAEGRKQVVFGSGDPDSDLLLVGEAPGHDEDEQGVPFVGPAGTLLNRMLESIGLGRDSVYMMNTVKCRPPNNRDPRPEEVEACQLWFSQQIDALQPKMICVLGRVAAQTLLKSDLPLRELRGCWHEYQGIPVRVIYHPAYLLRSPRQKAQGWQDLRVLSGRFRALAGGN